MVIIWVVKIFFVRGGMGYLLPATAPDLGRGVTPLIAAPDLGRLVSPLSCPALTSDAG